MPELPNILCAQDKPEPGAAFPTLTALGTGLLHITTLQRITTVTIPFVAAGGFFCFAHFRLYPFALLSVVYLSFVTYGSISHDLVHRTLGLPRRVNEFFLTAIELLAFRAGHAYRLAHLHHHARFPHDDDIEGAAAKMSLARTLMEGILFWPKILRWTLTKHAHRHPVVVLETVLSALLLIACFAALPWTPLPAAYATLMLMGHWAIPLATSYIPHNHEGRTTLTQTHLFRGKLAALISLHHLYHLEHHLYPQVPHHNWPKLAKRLDPYFQANEIKPIVLGF